MFLFCNVSQFTFYDQIYIEGLCHGNLLEDEAKSIANIFSTSFLGLPLAIDQRHQEHILCLPTGSRFIRRVPVKNIAEVNSVVEVTLTFLKDLELNHCFRVTYSILGYYILVMTYYLMQSTTCNDSKILEFDFNCSYIIRLNKMKASNPLDQDQSLIYSAI